MSAPASIVGNVFVCIGYTTQLYDSTSGGVWSSSNNALATVDAATGIVTGIALGSVVITYTVGATTATLSLNVVPVQVSNGFNLARIYPAFIGRMGFSQPTIAGAPVLDVRNTTNTSGRYWTEGHELVTVMNIYNTQEDREITDQAFNDYLQKVDQAALMRCLNAVFDMSAFIEHRLCYLRRAYQQNVLIPKTANGAFCGYRILIAPGDYAVVFNAISLFFNGVATFNIYLFNDLLAPPVKYKSVTTTANSQNKVQLDWVISYIREVNNGGIWYIGYFDSDLPAGVQAIDEQLNLWENSIVWSGTPFTSAKTAPLDFDRRYVGTVFYSYGLNAEMTSYRDYTQTLVQNAHLFDEVRILTYAIMALGIIKGSIRTNDQQNILQGKKDELTVDLNLAFPTRDYPFVAGLKQQLARALTSISDSFKRKPVAGSFPIAGGNNLNPLDYYEGFDINNLPARQTLT